VRERLGDARIRVVQTPFRAPNANARAERFVRSIEHECLSRVTPFGARHLRRTISEFVEHYHGERNHQGIGNELIDTARTVNDAAGGFAGVNVLEDFSTTTLVRHDETPSCDVRAQRWDITGILANCRDELESASSQSLA
jgi:transposase InsO family protein